MRAQRVTTPHIPTSATAFTQSSQSPSQVLAIYHSPAVAFSSPLQRAVASQAAQTQQKEVQAKRLVMEEENNQKKRVWGL
jgi:hypothetical protein